MPGLVIKAPTTFADPSLPRVGLTPIPSIPGAFLDWAADALPLDTTVTDWYDRISGTALSAPVPAGQRPTVVADPTHGRVLRFDGVAQRLDGPANLAGPRTMVLVGRWPTPAASQYATAAMSPAGAAWFVYINSVLRFAFSTGGTALSVGAVPADSAMHCIIAVADGAGSVLRIDSTEVAGAIPASTGTSLRVGATAGAYAPIDLKRLAFLPYAATATERAAIQATMAAHYGIS